ncbi:MAG: transposase [Nitrososphaerales archaeon]
MESCTASSTKEQTSMHAFIDFIEALRRKHGKLLLFFDNARWHTGQKVQEYLSKMKDEIKAVLFPKYSPELNPIETEWREIRKALGKRFFSNTGEMIEYMQKVIPTQAVSLIKLFDYLTP